MSWLPSNDPILGDPKTCDALELVIVPRTRDLGDGSRCGACCRTAQRQMVGPFIFFDHLGPVAVRAGQGLDVRPHPHIGLATVTYLFEGEILHRDSLGTRPADPAGRRELDDRRARHRPFGAHPPEPRARRHAAARHPDLGRAAARRRGGRAGVRAPRGATPAGGRGRGRAASASSPARVCGAALAGRGSSRRLFYADAVLDAGRELAARRRARGARGLRRRRRGRGRRRPVRGRPRCSCSAPGDRDHAARRTRRRACCCSAARRSTARATSGGTSSRAAASGSSRPRRTGSAGRFPPVPGETRVHPAAGAVRAGPVRHRRRDAAAPEGCASRAPSQRRRDAAAPQRARRYARQPPKREMSCGAGDAPRASHRKPFGRRAVGEPQRADAERRRDGGDEAAEALGRQRPHLGRDRRPGAGGDAHQARPRAAVPPGSA